MSLDVYIISDSPVKKDHGSGIFVRENGRTIEVSEEYWYQSHPGHEAVKIRHEQSEYETNEVYSSNITHNLTAMADAAGIYRALWKPFTLKLPKEVLASLGDLSYDQRYDLEEKTEVLAFDLIEPLREGLHKLKMDPEDYKMLNPENGWGNYEGLVEFVENYLNACYKYPTSKIVVSR